MQAQMVLNCQITERPLRWKRETIRKRQIMFEFVITDVLKERGREVKFYWNEKNNSLELKVELYPFLTGYPVLVFRFVDFATFSGKYVYFVHWDTIKELIERSFRKSFGGDLVTDKEILGVRTIKR